MHRVRECTDESKTKEFRGKGSSLARRGILMLDDDLPKLVLVRVEVDTIRGNMCLFYTWVSRICNQDGAVARVRPRGRSAPREAACAESSDLPLRKAESSAFRASVATIRRHRW